MFDAVRNNKKIVQIFLAVITLPFAVWGLDAFMHKSPGDIYVAKVGKTIITQERFQQTLHEQEQRMRESMQGQFSPEMLKTPEVRRAILEDQISQELVREYARQERIGVSDEQLRQMLMSIPQLQVDGKFSKERYEQAARAQGMSMAGMDAKLKQDLAERLAVTPVVTAALNSKEAVARWQAIALEEREVNEQAIKPESYLSKVQVSPEAIKKFYDDNQSKFQMPEQVRFELVVLSPQAFFRKVQVSEAEARAWYDEHRQEFLIAPEERLTSHILISVAKGAKPEEVKAAEDKANALLAQVKKNPADFARLAKENSQDPISAANGGNLGPAVRGGLGSKALEDAAFSLKEKEVTLVKSDFGFHIVTVTRLKAERIKPFAEVKDQATNGAKVQAATKKYAEAATDFSNMVSDQADSLKPVMEKFGLESQTTPWLQKGRAIPGISPKLTEAVFSDDAIQQKRNTEAIELGPNALGSARVVEHKPAATMALAEVQAQIEAKLKREEAAKLAAKDAEEKLKKYAAGDTSGATWSAARSVPRAGAQAISGDSLRAIFKLPADKLPAYTSAQQPDGSTVIYRLNKVKAFNPDEKRDDPRPEALRQQYARMTAEMDFAAWLANLRERYKVEVNEKALLESPAK